MGLAERDAAHIAIGSIVFRIACRLLVALTMACGVAARVTVSLAPALADDGY
jgi:hypothetical protein